LSTVSLDKYVRDAKQANTHPAKLLILSRMLEELFNVKLQDLIPGIERKLGSKVLGVKGSADLLFSNVVFEIKVNLRKEEGDAKNQLKKYFQALYEKYPDEKFIGIATDGIVFKDYLPIIENGTVIDIKEISSLDVSKATTEETILWLDSRIFSKPKIRPTADDLKFRFGPESPTYSLALSTLNDLWNEVKDEPSVKLKFDLWAKNMEIVYGSRPKEEAFIDQTYLVTLVKLMVYYRLSRDNVVKAEQIKRALTGEYFQSYGILNLIEEDFFAWILHPKIADRALDLMCDLARGLLRYDMEQADEDLFKEIYQEIVKRSERHRVGEYYTPEWLVELTLKEALNIWSKRNKDKDDPRILDPACGSGTFLCNAIHIIKDVLKNKGKQPAEILDFILNGVVGVDINPLAVTIAKANYLIALGELLRIGKSIVIPVYVSDSIKLPEIKTVYSFAVNEAVQVYEITVEKHKIQIPSEIAKHRYKLGQVLSGLREALSVYKLRKNRDEAKAIFNRKASEVSSKAELEILNMTLNTLFKLVDKQLNEIWVYMLNNIYAPIALKEAKFDILASNPPWIAMRYIENKNYQDWLKQEILDYELLSSEQVHLFTNMEIATLFYNRCADFYLHDKDGIIAFVMPRSVLTGALHHVNFKQFKKPLLKLTKVLDFEHVIPLFNVPSCVLIAIKGEGTRYPVLTKKFIGKFDRKNLHLNDALQLLRVEDYAYSPPKISLKKSVYYKKFKEGACIIPRSFWFVDFVVHPILGGFDAKRPLVKTSSEVLKQAKEPWKNAKIEGNVEANFIYVTMLTTDMVSFGYVRLRPIVLPVKKYTRNYSLVDIEALRNNGFTGMSEWLETAQQFWKKGATEKALKNHPRVISWLNYMNKLSNQDPSKRFIVIYNKTGSNIVSCVVDKENIRNTVLEMNVKPQDFIVDYESFYYETTNELEAHYISAMLNSNVINKLIKPLQTKGLFGARHITRRPFMLPIPKFDPDNSVHLRLAELSKICHEKIAELKFTKKSIIALRREAREVVKNELKEIDELVSKIIGEKL
jgi:methylase of polypeptide subunit release factors